MSARSTPPGGSPHPISIAWRARGCGSPTPIRRRRCARRPATACSPAAIPGARGCRAACCGATATPSSNRTAPRSRRCSAIRAITPPASASGISVFAGPPRRARRPTARPTPRRRRSTGSITADGSRTGRPITDSSSSSACRRRSTCGTTCTSTATASPSHPPPRSRASRRRSRPFTARAGRAPRSAPSACLET